MVDAPKTTLLNNIDDLDLTFMEGENELEFEIDDYSFTVTYSLEYDDILLDDNNETVKGGKKLKILSINAYDNVDDEDIDVLVDDELQKLFSDYYNSLIDDDFAPLNVNFGKFEDFF
jgi:hypothetical protein